MAVARFAVGRPAANTDMLLHTIARTALASIVSVNIGGATTISAWVVPSGQESNPENWIHYINSIPFRNRDTFETFKLAVNVGDKIYVSSGSGDVTFFINGIYDVTGRANVTTGSQEPESPQVGDIWINDSVDPQEVFYWDGSEWQGTGVAGPANVLNIGTVTASAPGSSASATITGTSPSQTLNLTLPRGEIGPANVLSVGTVTASAPGATPTVTINGTSPAQTISFVLPRGETGPTGPMGPENLPEQSGQAGKYLSTDGSLSFWDTVDALPLQTGNGGKYLTTDGTDPSWAFLSGGSASPTPPDVGLIDGTIWMDTDGSVPAPTVNIIKWTKTATTTSATFSGTADGGGASLAYNPGKEQVFLNGVMLTPITDYTAVNGTSIILASNVSVGDVVQVITIPIVSVVDIQGIPDTIFDAKGDLITATADNAPAKLPVGSNGQFLKANSSTATGLEWAAVDVAAIENNYIMNVMGAI